MPVPAEQFAAAIIGWSDRRMALFLRSAIALMVQVGHAGTDVKIFDALLKNLLPLELEMRDSALRQIIDAIRNVADEQPEMLAGALNWIVKSPVTNLPCEDLRMLLDLMVRVDFVGGERFANLILPRVIALSDDDAKEACATSLVYLCGLAAGAQIALDMQGRLARDGIDTPRVAAAALRMVASSEPSRLVQALRSLSRSLARFENHESLVALMIDIIDRSSAGLVLSALGKLDPSRHKEVARAAFGCRSFNDELQRGAFELRRFQHYLGSRNGVIEGYLAALFDNERYDLDDLYDGGEMAFDDWRTLLFRTTGVTPPLEKVVFLQTGVLAGQFGKRM